MTTVANIGAQAESQVQTPRPIISLIAITPRGSETIRIHSSSVNKELEYNGHNYVPYPCRISGDSSDLENPSDSPVMELANIQGLVSDIIRDFDGLEGAEVWQYRVFMNDDGELDESMAFAPSLWYVSRKLVENAVVVRVELRSPLEVDDYKLPRRMISKYCVWKYRGEECGYTGESVTNSGDILIPYTYGGNERRFVKSGQDLFFGDVAPDVDAMTVDGDTIRPIERTLVRTNQEYDGTDLPNGSPRFTIASPPSDFDQAAFSNGWKFLLSSAKGGTGPTDILLNFEVYLYVYKDGAGVRVGLARYTNDARYATYFFGDPIAIQIDPMAHTSDRGDHQSRGSRIESCNAYITLNTNGGNDLKLRVDLWVYAEAGVANDEGNIGDFIPSYSPSGGTNAAVYPRVCIVPDYGQRPSSTDAARQNTPWKYNVAASECWLNGAQGVPSPNSYVSDRAGVLFNGVNFDTITGGEGMIAIRHKYARRSSLDVCPKNLRACRRRFRETPYGIANNAEGILPYGGFPGAR